MGDETEIGSAGASDERGYPRGGSREQSPLQARAQFLKNRSWDVVVSLNRGACARGGAQHGFNRETQKACEAEWELKQQELLSLAETIDFLRSCHKTAPFLFFNGNTFADIGRQIAAVVFAELPTSRRREVMSAIAHFIAGVLPREAMVEIVDSICRATEMTAGMKVKTFRGSLRGIITRVLDDGRVVWKPEGSAAELIALPETLLVDEPKRGDS